MLELEASLATLRLVQARAPSELGTALRRIDQRLSNVRSSVTRIDSIIRDFMALAVDARDTFVPIDARVAVDKALTHAAAAIRPRANVFTDLGDVPALVLGTEVRLVQVILNLLSNATQAIPEGSPDRHMVSVRLRVRPRDVMIDVTDTGVGIPAEHLPMIFEPSFTTKPQRSGSGFGLAIVDQLVAALDGRIQVESPPGQGATFRVVLPRWSSTTE